MLEFEEKTKYFLTKTKTTILDRKQTEKNRSKHDSRKIFKTPLLCFTPFNCKNWHGNTTHGVESYNANCVQGSRQIKVTLDHFYSEF